jgi:hypothetical protein
MLWTKVLVAAAVTLAVGDCQLNPNYRILPYSVSPVQYPRTVPRSPQRRDALDLKQVEDFKNRVTGPFLTSPMTPRGEIFPLGGMFTPSYTPRGEHSLQFRRMEG